MRKPIAAASDKHKPIVSKDIRHHKVADQLTQVHHFEFFNTATLYQHLPRQFRNIKSEARLNI